MNPLSAAILGGSLLVGLALAGYSIGESFVGARLLDRTVTVKGLAEREVPADTAIWPIQFVVAGNELGPLLETIEAQTASVSTFLEEQGFGPAEISLASPVITDRLAQSYGPDSPVRFTVAQVITVFSPQIDRVRGASRALLDLGKSGIVFAGSSYELRTEYLFNGLNDIKPAMVEEATRHARSVAEKFAADSGSRLGRIKTARQGQFSIADRDSNTPHIKRVRVVSTLEYYLAD